LVQCRIQGFRAFHDTGLINVSPVTAIVGRNDAGKSSILQGLNLFFHPPKRGGLKISEIHNGIEEGLSEIELAFDPTKLVNLEIGAGTNRPLHLQHDGLTDRDGLLRMRIKISTNEIQAQEIQLADVDDPELFPLALKTESQLNALLRARELGLQAGESATQKRARLRQTAINAGRAVMTQWVDAADLFPKIREVLPEFAYFTDEADFAVQQTTVQSQFKGVIDRAVAALPEANVIEDRILAALQGEFDKVYERLAQLTDGISSLRASSKIAWKKAVEDVGLTWTDPSGVEVPFAQRGAGLRRLFMVAYFQYQTASGAGEVGGPRYVFAIEEPEVHLHPGAQHSLNEAFEGLAAVGHVVLLATHSPTFVASSRPTAILLVTRDGDASHVSQGAAVNYPDLARELGVEASDRLVGKNHVVLVEGRSDAQFFAAVLRILFAAGQVNLNPADVMFLQCGGIGSLLYTVTERCMDEVNLYWAAVTDSDRPVQGAPEADHVRAVRAAIPASCRLFHALTYSRIENYLNPAAVEAVANVRCDIPRYGKPTTPAGGPLRVGLVKQIKDAAAQIAEHMGVEGLIARAPAVNGRSEWVEMFGRLSEAFDL
jgi:hypothetical protein